LKDAVDGSCEKVFEKDPRGKEWTKCKMGKEMCVMGTVCPINSLEIIEKSDSAK